MDNGSAACTVIGVPLDLGSENIGSSEGPSAFRKHHLIQKLELSGLLIDDIGDVQVHARAKLDPGNPKMRYLDEIVRVGEAVAKLTATNIEQGKRVLILGGDHAVGLGSFSGASTASKGELGMIYIDAHPDINTVDTTLTGSIHGMHLAALMGFGSPELVNVFGKGTKLATENLLHIGASDWDPAELQLMKQARLHTFTLFDLLSKALGPLCAMIDELAARVPNIWVSLDLDAIDKAYAPGVSLPNDRGFTYREILAIAEYIGTHCNVVGVDIVEYNPRNDIAAKTIDLSAALVAQLFGRSYSSYSQYVASHHTDSERQRRTLH